MKSGTFRFMTRPRPHLPAHLSACPLFQRFAERCAYNSTHPHGPTQLTLKHSYMPPLNLLSSSFLDKMPPSRLPAPAYFFSILRERRDDLSELRKHTSPKSKAETTARREAEEESRYAEAVFAASTGVEVVVRAPGKRRATKATATGN